MKGNSCTLLFYFIVFSRESVTFQRLVGIGQRKQEGEPMTTSGCDFRDAGEIWNRNEPCRNTCFSSSCKGQFITINIILMLPFERQNYLLSIFPIFSRHAWDFSRPQSNRLFVSTAISYLLQSVNELLESWPRKRTCHKGMNTWTTVEANHGDYIMLFDGEMSVKTGMFDC